MSKNTKKLDMNQTGRLGIAFLLLAVVVLAGCQGQSILDAVFPLQEEPFGISESSKESSDTIDKEILPTPIPPEFIDLNVWVPQQFNIESDTDASVLLRSRFQEFSENNPQVNLNVRTKPAIGPGSILETLASASMVAPETVPSLILISRSDLVQAASENLLVPLEGLSNVLDDNDWFDVSRALGIYGGMKYCFPFATNALGLVYKQIEFNSDQPSWTDVIRQSDRLFFSSGDPEALTTIALYLSAGGSLPGKSGLPGLDRNALTTVFSAYAVAAEEERISDSLLEYQNDDQVWAAFISSNRSSVITWVNHILAEPDAYNLAILPSFGDEPYTLASGWLWCMPAANEEDRIQSIALAEYLSAPDFLALWAPLSGYLPVRPSTIQGYKETSLQNIILKILDSAHVQPDKSQISEIGAEFKRAISELLLQQNSPEDSAQNIIVRLEAMNPQ